MTPIDPKKSLGQNFLTSSAIIETIIKTAEIRSADTILEVGSGEGILTEALLKYAGKVVTVEKDHRLIPVLQKKFETAIASGKLILIEGDILNFSPAEKLKGVSYKIIANIPYYITGVFLRKFLDDEYRPSYILIMVQKEIAERIVAKDGKRSILSLSIESYGAPRYVETVPRTFFKPEPNVDSALLEIKNISNTFFETTDKEKFFRILKKGFAHKRKRLLANLEVTETETKTLETECGIGVNARAEELTLTQWEKLTSILK